MVRGGGSLSSSLDREARRFMLGAFVPHRVPSLVRDGLLALPSRFADALVRLRRLLSAVRTLRGREDPLTPAARRRAVAFADSLVLTLNLPEA